MSDSNLKILNDAGNNAPASSTNPTDLKSLRLRQDFVATAGVKKLLTKVPVRKPNPQDFVRVHPSEEYRMDMLAIVRKEERETFIVARDLQRELLHEASLNTIYTGVNRQGVVFLWPVRLPAYGEKINDWWTSAREAAELAMRQWVRVQANMALGAYEVTVAESLIAEPVWPEKSYQELIDIAFRGRVIDDINNPVVRDLRGLA
jgi:hypothetical protein